MFENQSFIKAPIPFVKEYDREKNPCVLFRKDMEIANAGKAVLYLCGLGYGYCFINGQRISEDLFIAPVSDYRKTLWYTAYDVTHLLKHGKNSFAVLCGNGFYNEAFNTPWKYNEAAWRDNPKLMLRLETDGKTVLTADETWKCTDKTPIVFNALRSGEHYDSRLWRADFLTGNIDDYKNAIADTAPPGGIFRECLCEPIRECAVYKTRRITKTGERRFVFDIGQNISGYIRLKIKQNSGDLLVIRYAEQLKEDNSLQLNGMDGENYYPESEFMTDKFICNGEKFSWSPIFAYHGFRYIEIEGLDEENAKPETVSGVFVHQYIKTTSSFECSNKDLNELFRLGQMAVYSNLFYMATDCPTREKLGWINDTHASGEQMYMNFAVFNLFRKWYVDILDAQREDGALPGIIPTPGWGFHWGNGPVADGMFFDFPWQLYRHTGDNSLLKNNLAAFKKYFEYIYSRVDDDGFVAYGLDDWASPEKFEGNKTPLALINSALAVKFARIAVKASEFAGDNEYKTYFEKQLSDVTEKFQRKFLNNDGGSKINEQTALAFIIAQKLYTQEKPVVEQFKKTIEEKNFHHNCGMAGMPQLFLALDASGLNDYAYKILTSRGYPSFNDWLDGDATTLWETWQEGSSKNHHMFSCFMAWLMKSLVGIRMAEGSIAWNDVEIKPYFAPLDFCKGHVDTPQGKIAVSWERKKNGILLTVDVPRGINAMYDGKKLAAGHNSITVHE